MIGRTLVSLHPRRASSAKLHKKKHRVLRGELLEPRMMLDGMGFSASSTEFYPLAAMANARASVNSAPALARSIAINNNTTIYGKTASLSVLGRDNGGESALTYTWAVTSSPAGGRATFVVNGSNAAKYTAATFTKAGTYKCTVKIVDAAGLSVSASKSVVVSPTLTSVKVKTAAGQLVNPNSAWTVSGTSQTFVAQGFDQFGCALTARPTFKWSSTSIPSNAIKPKLTTSGGAVSETFRKAGNYGLQLQVKGARNAAVTVNLAISVVQTTSGVRNQPTTPSHVSGTSLKLPAPTLVDQFGSVIAGVANFSWSTLALPVNATSPTFASSCGITTATFGMAGSYTLKARAVNVPSISFTSTVIVHQTLSSITVSPNTPSVLQGAAQQFQAQAFDQFHRGMVNRPAFTWSAGGGTINASGLFTAPSDLAACIVTARSGSISGFTSVTIAPIVNTTDLAALADNLDDDGSISRLDMIQILRSAGNDGIVDAAEFADMQTLVGTGSTWNMPSYVQVLAADIVNGNAANAKFQGQTLGNLAVGSSATQLNRLIDKWFFGADHPTFCHSTLTYQAVAGSLFTNTPSHNDGRQGALGDCYFISALGRLADINPSAVQNMFLDNGDGTYTVRFYTGTYGTIYNFSDGSISAGFRRGVGTADYVTVDRMLPVGPTGILVYANYGAMYTNTANTLWLALAEKAYAQWNETGKEGRDGLNAYASIQGGWMATVDAQVLGYNATDYVLPRTQKQVLVDALASNKAVTIGTLQWSGTNYGLYSSHAYAITGYDAATDTFTLYNPWGYSHPGPLTWSQLQAACSQFVVADTSQTVSISGLTLSGASLQTSLVSQTLNETSDILPAASATQDPDAIHSRQFSDAVASPSFALESLQNHRMYSRQIRFDIPEDSRHTSSLVDALFSDPDFIAEDAVGLAAQSLIHDFHYNRVAIDWI